MSWEKDYSNPVYIADGKEYTCPNVKKGDTIYLKNKGNRMPLFFKYTLKGDIINTRDGDFCVEVGEEEVVWLGYATIVNFQGVYIDKKVILNNSECQRLLRGQKREGWNIFDVERAFEKFLDTSKVEDICFKNEEGVINAFAKSLAN